MSNKRLALIITCSEYIDTKLNPLPSAQQDATDLERVLSNPVIGDFQVTTLLNKAHHETLLAIEDFVSERDLDDLLLLHFSGHGLKDKDGRLYFAASNTRTDRLVSSAIPATAVNELLSRSRSQRKVLVLDCCYGGAFLRGITARADKKVGATERFQTGRGLIVLTASDALQYAYEGEVIMGKAKSSAFTSIVVEGIESGKADIDGDGLIAVSELYQYVYDRIQTDRPEQRPELTNFRVQGDIYIAKTRNVTIRVYLTHKQAQSGGNKIIQVGNREEEICIPPEVVDGYEEKYQGRGLTVHADTPPGDLIVVYIVARPRRNFVFLLSITLVVVLLTSILLVALSRHNANSLNVSPATDVAGEPTLKLKLTDVYGKYVQEKVTITLYNEKTPAKNSSYEDQDGSSDIMITGLLPTPETYEMIVTSPSYWPVRRFIKIGQNGVTELDITFCVNARKVRAVDFLNYEQLPKEIAVLMENSANVQEFAGKRGKDLYLAFDNLRKANLLNTTAKLQRLEFASGETVFALFDELKELRGDTLLVSVDKRLREIVKASVPLGFFRAVDGSLHQPPAGFSHAGSFKTTEQYGSVQLTFYLHNEQTIVFIDLDEGGAIKHLFQVPAASISNPTHPYYIHDTLVFYQHIDPGYQLVPER